MKENILTQLKEVAQKILNLGVEVKLAEYKTKDGETINVDDSTQETKTPDGEYTLENGATIVIKDGKLQPAKEEETEEKDLAGDKPEDQTKEDAGDTQVQAKVDELTKRIEALEKALADSDKNNTALSEINDSLKATLSAIESKPADKKVILAANQNPANKSEGQSAWERYNGKK